MPEEPTGKPDVLLSETEVRQVLERAARLETGSGSLSVQELQRVAQEAGFSPETISLAVREILETRGIAQSAAQSLSTAPGSAPAVQSAAPGGRFARLRRLFISALAGGTTALVAHIASGPNYDLGAAVFPAIVIAVATAFRAFQHRREGKQEDFQLEVAGVWVAFSSVWTLAMEAHGGSDRTIFFFAGIWLVSALVGGLIVMSRPRDAGRGEILPPVRQ